MAGPQTIPRRAHAQHAEPDLQLARRALLASAALLLTAGQAAWPSLPAASAEAEAGSAGAAQPVSKVFVAGATGQTGRRVVRELRARGFTVVAGVRVCVHACMHGVLVCLCSCVSLHAVQAKGGGQPACIALQRGHALHLRCHLPLLFHAFCPLVLPSKPCALNAHTPTRRI